MASGDNLTDDSVDADDEQPLCEPSKEAADPEGPGIVWFHNESGGVD